MIPAGNAIENAPHLIIQPKMVKCLIEQITRCLCSHDHMAGCSFCVARGDCPANGQEEAFKAVHPAVIGIAQCAVYIKT